MGQLALGFRSLLTKAAVFFVMAALLAWALGGTLWPRPHVVDEPAVVVNGTEWWWRMTVGGSVQRPQWTMMSRGRNGNAQPLQMNANAIVFHEIAGPHLVDGGVTFGGRAAEEISGGPWQLFLANRTGALTVWSVPDRLALEQQVARLRAGMDVQAYETILRQRRTVLDPADDGSRP